MNLLLIETLVDMFTVWLVFFIVVFLAEWMMDSGF